MAIVTIIGGQWGDEGKGKIIDHLAKNADHNQASSVQFG